MIISELGDRDVSDDGDPDYEESGNETDGESENECGCGSAPVYSSISCSRFPFIPSNKRKRNDGKHGHVVGASPLLSPHPLHDLNRETNVL